MENSETQVWLDFSFNCGYIHKIQRQNLIGKSEEVVRLLNQMICFPQKYLRKNEKSI